MFETHGDGIDVRFMACEGVPAHSIPYVPKLLKEH